VMDLAFSGRIIQHAFQRR